MNIIIVENILEDWIFEDLEKEIEKHKKDFKTEDRGHVAKYDRWYPENGSKVANIAKSCIYSEKLKKLADYYRDLAWRVFLANMPTKFEVQVTKYPIDANLGYNWHIDHISPDRRILNWIIFVTDSYSGGELEISEELIRNDTKIKGGFSYEVNQSIKPKKNMLVMLPSWMIHRVRPVFGGNPRITLNGHIS